MIDNTDNNTNEPEIKSGFSFSGFFRWAFNIAFNAMLLWWAWTGGDYAANAIPAFAALNGLLHLVALFNKDVGRSVRRKRIAKDDRIPFTASCLLSLAVFFGYAALGWYFTAAAGFISLAIGGHLCRPKDEHDKVISLDNDLEKSAKALQTALELADIYRRELLIRQACPPQASKAKDN